MSHELRGFSVSAGICHRPFSFAFRAPDAESDVQLRRGAKCAARRDARLGTVTRSRHGPHYRAKALRYGEGDHYLVPPDAAGGGGVRAIEFEVLENLTPRSGVATASMLYIGGRLTTADDFNRGTVPYLDVRTAGQHGSCFASDYRRGGEFLLLLRLAPSGYYTPYWALLSPVNEQIHGADDPWVQWVRRERPRRPASRNRHLVIRSLLAHGIRECVRRRSCLGSSSARPIEPAKFGLFGCPG